MARRERSIPGHLTPDPPGMPVLPAAGEHLPLHRTRPRYPPLCCGGEQHESSCLCRSCIKHLTPARRREVWLLSGGALPKSNSVTARGAQRLDSGDPAATAGALRPLLGGANVT